MGEITEEKTAARKDMLDQMGRIDDHARITVHQ